MDSGTIPVEQAALERALRVRIEACRHFAAGVDNRTDMQLVLVLGDLDLVALVRLLRAVCASTPPEVLRHWVANFTKVIVLAGNPDKLTSRFRALPFAVEGKIAAVGPAPAKALSGLRRLLRPAQGSEPGPEVSELLFALEDAAPDVLELSITSSLGLGEFLVSLSHTVAEATLFGHFAQGSTLRIHAVADLGRPSDQDLYARVLPASDDDPGLCMRARLLAVARALPAAGLRS